ncbi:MAG: hypothetical protein GY798_34830 [Hyphomicrobiales bacterium]|nr:hypothetical protein [Hyphomicrobiales bacterium]
MFLRALAAAAALLLSATAAPAEPPASGFQGTITDRPVLHCWKEEALRQLVAAYQADFNKGADLFMARQATGVCGIIGRLGTVAVGDVEALGVIDPGTGNRVRVWIIHVGNATKHTWIIYDEPDPGLDV